MLHNIIGGKGSAQPGRGWRPATRQSNRFRNITIVLALVGLLCASQLGADIAAMAFFTLIGIPLTIAIMLLPTIALATVIAFAIWRLTPLSGHLGIAMAYAAAIGLMLAVPPLHNFEVEAKIAQLKANDVEPDGGRVLKTGHDTVIGFPGTDRRASRCDLTCMHMLVSHQAPAVVMTRFDKEALTPDFDAEGYRYQLDRRSVCDLSFVVAYNPDFKERRQGTIAGAYGNLVDSGTCIVRRKARLSDADVVVSSRRWQKIPQPFTISPIASGIRASRFSVHKPASDGSWQPVWQKTAVEYSLLKPVLAHSWRQSGYSFDPEWWRTHFRAEPHLNLLNLLSAMNYDMPERLR